MENIKIRAVQRGDEGFLTELMNRPALKERLHQTQTTTEDWAEAIALWLQDPDEKGYIVETANQRVGWFAVNGLLERKAYVKIAVLLPEYQGSGIGGWVLSELMEELRKEGYGWAGLFVDSDNEMARNCYEKCGFQISGRMRQEWPDGTVSEQLEMKLRLGQEEIYETF